MKKHNVAVVGCGYWDPNLIRNFIQIPDCHMKVCCDLDAGKLQRMQNLYPALTATSRLEDILHDPEIDAVAIATPVHTHLPIGKICLEHHKHVLIEKPLAASAEECLELIHLAEKHDRILMVGHTFQYAAAVNKAKEIVASGELGEIYYINCSRANLGLFQSDINVIWDLAPHDISIITYILEELPLTVNAQGKAHFKPNIEDVATVTLNFPNYDTFAEFHFAYRYGDIYTPRLSENEPLRRECEHFLECISESKVPRSNGYAGLLVVSILEAANKSLLKNGARQPINDDFFLLLKKVA
ncbi:MAG: Gfo/Idh/MocA family protein [bacterium]